MEFRPPTRGRMIVSATLFTTMLGAIFVFVHLDPKVQAKMVQAFGPSLWGVPMYIVCMVVSAALFVPAIPVCWHLMLLAVQALAEQRRMSIGYLLTAYRHDHLRRSWWWCMGGLAYFGLICGAWIAWAAYKGI